MSNLPKYVIAHDVAGGWAVLRLNSNQGYYTLYAATQGQVQAERVRDALVVKEEEEQV